MHWITIDARSGQVMDDAPSTPHVIDVILKLHKELLAGVPGELFLGAMGLVFIVSIISGVAVYDPFMRKLDLGTIRKQNFRRLKWLDIHNLFGIATLMWALVVGATGVINTLSGTWDVLSWLALSVPVGVIVWHVVRPASETPRKSHEF